MLEVRELSVRYGTRMAVDDLTLTLDEDEILTIVGPTGCGKTSVLRTVAGLIPPTGGEIRIGALRIDTNHSVPPEKRHVGLVFQDFALFPHLNVEQNVGFRLRSRAPADRWITRLGLEAYRHATPDTLSGGQKQRVALARALAHEPSLLLLDEPLASLDAALKTELRWEIRDTLKAAGIPALWVTHDQTEALSVGDRMGVMRAGRLEQIGPPETCFSRPFSRFVARFLGDAAFLPGDLHRGRVHTVAGEALVPNDTRCTPVDVLVRPDDLSLARADDGNSRIEWSRYEGETRLYGVRLNDGTPLRVRTNHEHHLEDGALVDTRICSRHTLAVFPRDECPVVRDTVQTVEPRRTAALPGA